MGVNGNTNRGDELEILFAPYVMLKKVAEVWSSASQNIDRIVKTEDEKKAIDTG